MQLEIEKNLAHRHVQIYLSLFWPRLRPGWVYCPEFICHVHSSDWLCGHHSKEAFLKTNQEESNDIFPLNPLGWTGHDCSIVFCFPFLIMTFKSCDVTLSSHNRVAPIMLPISCWILRKLWDNNYNTRDSIIQYKLQKQTFVGLCKWKRTIPTHKHTCVNLTVQ